MTERRARSVSRVRQHTAEANTACDHAIDLSQRDLLAWTVPRDARLERRRASDVPDRSSTSGRKRRSATIIGTSPRASVSDTNVWQFAVLPRVGCILRSYTNRAIALLRHRCIVDDQHCIFATDEPVGLNEQFCFQRRRVPDAISDEMMQLVIVARASRAAIGWTLLRSPGPTVVRRHIADIRRRAL